MQTDDDDDDDHHHRLSSSHLMTTPMRKMLLQLQIARYEDLEMDWGLEVVLGNWWKEGLAKIEVSTLGGAGAGG